MNDRPKHEPTTPLLPRSEKEKQEKTPEKNLQCQIRRRISIFFQLGRLNPWIRKSWDPPFTKNSFHVCADLGELTDYLLRGNWCLGQAFILDDICFINQIDGGDEWLTIKGSTAFESITMKTFSESRKQAEDRLRENIGFFQNATEEQCKRLKYRTTPNDKLGQSLD